MHLVIKRYSNQNKIQLIYNQRYNKRIPMFNSSVVNLQVSSVSISTPEEKSTPVLISVSVR